MNTAQLTRGILWVTLSASIVACNTTGSCKFTTANGLQACEEYLGDLYEETSAQTACSTNNGAWSSNMCARSNTLGTCDVIPEDTDHAQNLRYTYYTTATTGQPAPTPINAEQACGLAGGSFTPPNEMP